MMRKTLPTTVAAEAAPLVSAEDAWERLWRSLPSVQKQHCINTDASKEVEGGAPLQQTARTEGSFGADVHRDAGSVSLLSVVLPRAEMAHLVTCVYLALHSNAIQSDTEAAVEGALRAPSLGKAHSDEAEAADAPRVLRETYTREDVIAFLESVPSRWMPDMIAARENEEEQSLWVEFNAELVDCVVSDEAPYNLLPPTEVFTIQRTAAAVSLEAPVINYVEVLPPRWYPAVYDTLFEKLQLNDDRSDSSLALAQFRIFFDWFHRLHFCNTDASRSSAAAEDVYNRYCDPRGQFSTTQFQLACEEMCAVYAQRRDAAAYLEQLVHRTEHVMAQRDEEGPAHTAQQASRMSAEFFLHPEEVTLPSWRRYLTSPVPLYMPDELRAVQQEMDRYHRHRCPRILLLGPAGIGKSEVGRQLAEELHCVHLDVLELAMAALRDTAQGDVAEELEACLAQRTAVPMKVQVRLLQDAMTSARAEFRGYIFSDTMSSTAETADAFLEHFVRPLQLSEMARPDHVVEVCTAVPDVYQEHASGRVAIVAAASQQAWDTFVKDEAQKARAVEKAQMRADCEKILAHLVEMEGATGKAAPPAADLELARQQAAEAQSILLTLEEEEEEEEGVAAERDQEDAAEEAEDTKRSSLPPLAAGRAAEVRLRLAALIRDGRIEAGAQLPFTTAEGAAVLLPSLEEQDWTSSWRKHVEFAKSIHHHLLVDPIASASTGHVTSYIAHVFHLYPCGEPALLGSAKTGEDEDGGEDGAHGHSTSVAADEERSRAVEEAAEEAGLSLSPVWKRYCPVTAFEDHVLIEGAACYACSYRGHYYCFASPSKRAAFVDFPIKYLRQRCSPDRKPVLVVADDTLVHSTDAMVETMQRVVGEVATQLNLTPYAVSEFVKLLEPRQALLQARHAACVGRQKAEEEARKARAERLELAAKAQAKKKKGKMEPRKPKIKKKAGGTGRSSFLQQALQDRQSSAPSSGGARRRVPRTMFLEGPQSMADEKAMHIRAAKEKAACTAPLLLSAVTSADLQKDILHGLWEGNLLPETVLVLRPADAPVEEVAEEDDEEEGEETQKGNAHGSDLSVLSQTLRLLKKVPKVERLSVMASRSKPRAQQPQPFNVLAISLPKTPVVHEVIAEVMQLLDPLAIQASEAAVDEALGEEDEDAFNEEAEEEAEEAAFLNPDGEAVPLVPQPLPHPLTRPMRRFLHQFGSRLDYCPVTLRERGILVRGRQEFCLRFVDGLYVFATQEARNAFARCPQRYVGELPPETLPPRVWLVGSTCSGKKTLAAGLHEAYRVPFFVYDRRFFEECVEAALTPGGGMVRGVYIPPDSEDTNSYVARARTLLEEVRSRAREEKTKLKVRAEAERLLQEREQREEERAARSDADVDEEDDDDEDDWDEAKEADLQEKLEYEPEDPEDKQERLREAYLRIASCVTRFRPFDTLGYVMICPPFSDGDLDILFDEGCIPEVVMRLSIDEETFAQRGALRAAERREAVEHAIVQDTAAKEVEATKQATQASRDAARLQRRREKALRKWRRRHIGVNDVDSPSEEEADADAEAPPAQGHSGDAQSGDDRGDLDSAAAAAIHGEGQLGMEEDYPTQEEALDEFMGIIEERLVEVVRVDGRAARETVCRAVVEALGRHMRHRASLFYVPEVMRFEDAKARLAAGGCDLSSFGYEDPVRLYRYRQEGPQTACAWKPAGVRIGPEQPLQESAQGFYVDDAAGDAEGGGDNELEEPEVLSEVLSDEVQELRDVVERRKRRRQRKAALRVARVNHRLYFFKDDDSLLRFVRDPWPFLRQAPPNPTLLQQPVVSVYEHDARYATEQDGAKERVLADSVAFNLGMKCISVSSLLAWGAVHPHWHALKLDCMLAAQQGSADPTLVHKLLALYLSTAEVKHSGAVLHNLPHTAISGEALRRVACAAPIVKVMATSSVPLRGGRAADHSAPDADGEADEWSAAVAALERHAAVRLPLPRPSVPLDASNLVAAVHGVEEYVQQAQESVLREQRAFPARLHTSYQVYSYVHRHLSQFTAFCPYEWLEHDDLVRSVHAPPAIAEATATSPLFWLPATNEVDLRWGAIYLNQYFFFSSAEYLERFLVDPTTVTDASKAKPMPKHFPVIMLHPVDEACLALEGCCPVLLYDTREFRGMRRVIQPVAKKGSLDCVVEYDGKLYALRDKEHMARFLRRPWQYVDGAHLPPVLRRPLPTGTSPSDIVDHEEYIQRQLYDPVALALLAVAQARPIYPGLSVEESALKYIALYLKAHRDPDSLSDFEEKTYRRHFEVYQQRASLYRHLPSSSSEAKTKQTFAESATGAVTASAAAAEREYCATFDNSMAATSDMSFFNRLPRPSDAAL
ncbi:conserved hypothetical protein [Leishmania major strain Friedlin]|uniref:Cilia- and flagella-associated protein 206 n=1 Tax=Leishmania major TaxID=5664 RepID=Q4Q0F7_LEIMA|nr:conserved hypothetical protein [Leishmania major strain Friedlin]CAG9584158.1 hypothetical_protein_-_conserved [Leishmania major strain Friedlin]CAJ09578.1 conserved hypothetical protein [Leishmania major strain Friedlin]|eukprot:XP_001687191.1 conserved hypothetical protein [Leishmania major strain Friedlin]